MTNTFRRVMRSCLSQFHLGASDKPSLLMAFKAAPFLFR